MLGCPLQKLVCFSLTMQKSRSSLERADMVFLWSPEAQAYLLFSTLSSLTHDFHPQASLTVHLAAHTPVIMFVFRVESRGKGKMVNRTHTT